MGLPAFSGTASHSGTIAPEALRSDHDVIGHHGNGSTSTYQDLAMNVNGQSHSRSQSLAGGVSGSYGRTEYLAAPKGIASGAFLVTPYEALVQETRSRRFHEFLNIGDIAQEYPITKTTLPQYVPRKSRNELKRVASGNENLLARLSKKPPKKSKISAPKAARPKTAANARSPTAIKEESPESSSETSSSDDDSEYESSDDELEITEPSPLPASRPQEPLQAVRYDVIKALWLPHKKAAEAEQIRNALKDFWEVVRTIRDRWKSDTADLKQAEEGKKESEVPRLKSRVKAQRDMIQMALKTAIEHGHPDIIRLFGENRSLVFVCQQFMVDRIREADYNGELSRAALELLSRCVTMTSEAVDATKLEKPLNIYTKRGDDHVKALVKKILENVTAVTKSKSEGVEKPPPVSGKDVKPKIEPVRRPAPEPVAGIKRRAGEAGAPGQAPKRVASGSPALGTTGSNAIKAASSTLKRPSAITATAGKSTPLVVGGAPKPKAATVAKPPTSYAGLQSASKKPGASKAGATVTGLPKVAPIMASKDRKPAASSAAAAPAKPAFSFAETMANLTKPKEPEVSAKSEEKRAPETAEEKAKRLRKEARSQLRVTFKPDASLVAIKYFTHDPEEELGHDESMIRDVGDRGGEGRMFKQHKDMMDIDEDDDSPREESFYPWKEPSAIDFSVVDIEERKRNFKPYGGGFKDPECPDKENQEKHEASTLMVFYTHPSDIPPSPREPPDDSSMDTGTTAEFGSPPDFVLRRAAAFELPKSEPRVQAPPSTTDISAVLSMLRQQQPQPQPQQPNPPPPQPQPTDLERLLATLNNPGFSSVPQAPVAAPAPMPVVPPQPQPAQAPDLSSLLAAINPQAAQVQQYQQQPPQPFQQPVMSTPDISALIASLSQAGAAQPSFQPPTHGFTFQNQQQQVDQGAFEHPERKRMMEGGYGDSDGANNKRPKWGDKKKGGYEPPKFVVPCRFWKEGKCIKGAKCTFLHE
ncbi:hypothetical protein W97_07769 [Coniosporium apollinis CBS 100218]|uniref:C3H1-type domain-containing protein n=1 Tax=Coniosporium apollinis (strain CBS 100218) TaxID=1168221 RepID=R7Z3K6_CONA1|nr:uncharacterized protein W97_07769 [Coniosporium apollinis CBS 100218]EON68511.1 hypothetical protein W97_07769 [Coniosporium apollinis CBS 100218]